MSKFLRIGIVTIVFLKLVELLLYWNIFQYALIIAFVWLVIRLYQRPPRWSRRGKSRLPQWEYTVPAHPVTQRVLHRKYGEPKIRAASGHMVRSHSERLIAETLHKAGVYFEYETPLEADGSCFFPDFTIKVGTRTYYLEHFGMQGMSEYDKKTARKITWYDRNFPGELLTCYAECRDIPRNIRRIIADISPCQ